jgi:hypothetical protein
MSATDVFARLGCPLKSVRQSWAGISPGGERAAFTLWADEVRRNGYILHPTRQRRPRPEGFIDADDRFGSVELREIAEHALTTSAECFGVLIKAADPAAGTRSREWCDEETVFRLELSRDGERIVAKLVSRVPIHEVSPLG